MEDASKLAQKKRIQKLQENSEKFEVKASKPENKNVQSRYAAQSGGASEFNQPEVVEAPPSNDKRPKGGAEFSAF